MLEKISFYHDWFRGGYKVFIQVVLSLVQAFELNTEFKEYLIEFNDFL